MKCTSRVAHNEGARRSGRIESILNTPALRSCQTTSHSSLSPLGIYLGPLNASIDGSYSSHLTRSGLLGVRTALSTMWQPSGGQYIALGSSPICQGFISTSLPCKQEMIANLTFSQEYTKLALDAQFHVSALARCGGGVLVQPFGTDRQICAVVVARNRQKGNVEAKRVKKSTRCVKHLLRV